MILTIDTVRRLIMTKLAPTESIASISSEINRPGRVVYLFFKRLVDIIGSLIAIALLLPVFMLAAIGINMESKGPVFYRQQRVGLQGKNFSMWKFRSMQHKLSPADEARLLEARRRAGVRFKMEDDPRITKVGKFIRKYSIDELPQLFNVLIGEMSLVGPRPALPSEVAEYTQRQMVRLQSIPGITCIWQVSGRSNIPFVQQVEMDIEYICNANIRLDLTLLLMTVPAVVFGKGAC
jgi:lipopolysaccharide/colanic/teichoic acid biosynthesis glycosyltransferase